jgi:aspartyl-tRNA(Asn)/glutamyl-tRNA(Gln) amidotransferase subunit B
LIVELSTQVKFSGNYEPVIGLEVHAQMLTKTKAFCGCPTTFGNEPNTNVCPICLGMPGTLPVLNINLVEFIMRLGLATDCTIAPRSTFARKNYFYPDLPKGYQISQYEEPICTNGSIEIEFEDGKRKPIGITRIHMEEDAGKSIHDVGADTLIDLNRCGVPLIEIVSEPDMRSPHEAYLYLWEMHQLVKYLGICDGNMEEGSLRCDANVSVRPKGDKSFGIKTELKNMNSFRHVERALEFEINRQIQLIVDGEGVVQETLLWDADRNAAFPMRSKEEAHDYRYFPDPDLVSVFVDAKWIERVRKGMPEIPTARRDRYINEFKLPRYDANVLTAERGTADYFEDALQALCVINKKSPMDNAKGVSNWVMTDVLRIVREQKIDIRDFPISSRNLALMIGLIHNGTISGKIAKIVFEEMVISKRDPDSIVEAKGLAQVSDTSVIENAIDQIIASSKQQVQQYLAGNEKLFGFFIGETMKLMSGKANPKIVNDMVRMKLEKLRTL